MEEAEGTPPLDVNVNDNDGGRERPSNSLATSTVVNRASVPARPVFMPETFTGVGREWSDWSEQFDLAAEVNNWDESLKIKFMSLLLSGRARDIYSGLSTEAKNDYELLKSAMARCFEPCDSVDWSRATFTSRRRMHNETAREFGNALRRLAIRAYPTADNCTRDMLARDQFISHFAIGDFRINLRTAKPKTLEDAIDLASEMELLRNLEQTTLVPEAKVRGVVENKHKSDEQMEVLLGVVEELRQEVKSLRTTVSNIQANMKRQNPIRPPDLSGDSPQERMATQGPINRSSRTPGGGCWECGCSRHIRRDCPYLPGNSRGQVP